MNKRKYGQTTSTGSSSKNRKYTKVYKKGDKSTVQLQKQIMLLKKSMVNNAPPVKTKWYIFDYNPTNEWFAMGLAWPILGGANNERLGQDIKIKSIQIKGLLDVASSDGFDTIRFVLVQVLDSNASATMPYGGLAQFVETITLDANSGDYPYIMPFRTQTKSAYRILHDQSYNLCINGQASACVDVLITAKDLPVTKIHYLNNSDTEINLPGLSEGMIIGLWCSDSSTSPNPKVECTVKLNYVDT